jgi:hypothetical protein
MGKHWGSTETQSVAGVIHISKMQCLQVACADLVAAQSATDGQIILAASVEDNSPSRIYLSNMESDRCPVCALILHIGTPDFAAAVAKPARSECPE